MVPAAVAFAFENDLVGGALRDDERLGDGVVVGLLGLELTLEVGDARILRGQLLVARGGDGRGHVLDARRRVETGERGVVQLALQLVYLRGHRVDLVGNVLQEHVHFVDIVALAVDREALVVDISRGDCHSRSLRPVRADAVQAQLKQVYYQTYPEL